MEPPAFNKEESMVTAESKTIANDVLHLGSQSKLSAEEIAKAIARHNKHHSGNNPQNTPGKPAAGKKHK
jgi:hypothetical protein